MRTSRTKQPDVLHKLAISLKKENPPEVVVPKEVTELPARFFTQCKRLRKLSFEKGSRISVLPEGLCCDCNELEKVEFPPELSDIGENAFSGTAIRVLELPASLVHVGASAFSNCNRLSAVRFAPDSALRELSAAAFAWCTLLREVALPLGLRDIGANCFAKCVSLEKIPLPLGLHSIGEGAFNCCETLIAPVFPLSLRVVEDRAFAGCVRFETVTLPAALEKLGSYLFHGCLGLKSLTLTLPRSFENGKYLVDSLFLDEAKSIPVSLGKIRVDADFPVKIGGAAGAGLRAAVLPQTTTELLDECFCDCTELRSFEMPPAVERIGDRAFKNCNNLEVLLLPDTVVALGTDSLPLLTANGNVLRVKKEGDGLYIGKWLVGMADRRQYPISGAPRDVEILDVALGTVGIYSFACRGHHELKRVNLPESVHYIGAHAFRGCKNLESVKLSDDVTYIGDCAFGGCQALQMSELPSGLKHLGIGAFRYCSYVTMSRLPKGVSILPEEAFRSCSSIRTFDSSNATEIGKYAFGDCLSLVQVHLNKCVRGIAECAFYRCTALEFITLPPKIKFFPLRDKFAGGGMQFYLCNRLACVRVLHGTVTQYFADLLFYVCNNDHQSSVIAEVSTEQLNDLLRYRSGLRGNLSEYSGIDPILEFEGDDGETMPMFVDVGGGAPPV